MVWHRGSGAGGSGIVGHDIVRASNVQLDAIE